MVIRLFNWHPTWGGGIIWVSEFERYGSFYDGNIRYLIVATAKEWLEGIHEW